MSLIDVVNKILVFGLYTESNLWLRLAFRKIVGGKEKDFFLYLICENPRFTQTKAISSLCNKYNKPLNSKISTEYTVIYILIFLKNQKVFQITFKIIPTIIFYCTHRDTVVSNSNIISEL